MTFNVHCFDCGAEYDQTIRGEPHQIQTNKPKQCGVCGSTRVGTHEEV